MGFKDLGVSEIGRGVVRLILWFFFFFFIAKL